MNKKIVIGTTLTAVAISILVPVAMSLPTSAYSQTGSSSLVDQLVSKFNLNKDDVQEVFDASHTEQENQAQNNQAEKLAAAVTDGKITQDQADKITAKLAEMKTERENNRDAMADKTEAEREESMELKKTELSTWAKENDIDISYLRMTNGGQHREMGRQ